MEQKTKLMALGALATAAFASVMLAGPPAPPQVSVDEVNPGTSVERDLCLSVSLAPGAASECGDLRLAHALPAVRTLNQARAPVLIYNSQHASPRPIVAAHVTLPDGAGGLSRVVATLKVNGTPRGQGVWKGSAWPGSGPVRIAVAYDAANDPTGPYRYTLEVRAHYGADTVAATARGQLVVVNRRDSPFGAGWWLAGLERLVLDPFGKPLLWVGGDGSTRRYTLRGDSMWGAPSLDRPDSIVRTATGWARLLPGRVRVEFDTAGRHVATVNRLKRRTEFLYDSVGRLDSIAVPTPTYFEGGGDLYLLPARPVRPYAFVYGADARLDRIESPDTGTAPRLTILHRTGARVDEIEDPDSTKVSFGYEGASPRVVSRKNRLGHETLFRYDSGGRLAASRLDLSAQDSIVTRLRALESAGLAIEGSEAVDTARAYALIDGPRTDVGDSTRLWLNRWGSPRRIRNALDHETLLFRENVSYPVLVTRTVAPNKLVTTAAYNARGQVDSVRVHAPYGEGQRDAVSRYAYTDPRWPEQVTHVQLPEGEITEIGYDPATGRLAWQGDGRGDSSRAVFAYDSRCGLPSSVRSPVQRASGASTGSVEYDKLCNVATVRTAIGFMTSYYKDALGRDTLVVSPIDSAQTLRQRHRIWYDRMDQPRETATTVPGMFSGVQTGGPDVYIGPQTLRIRTKYDFEGNPKEVARRSEPDPNQTGWIVTTWDYDKAGRKTRETDGLGVWSTTGYDLAGNVISQAFESGSEPAITLEYDALNRLERRTGWDIARFEYDEAGNMTSAVNPWACVSRSYYPGGALKTDTLVIETVKADSAPCASPHVYGLGYSYDLNGRRTRLQHPASMLSASHPNGLRDHVRYGYHPATGALDWIEGLGADSRFEYRYDLDGRLHQTAMPAGIVETRGYDLDGRLKTRVETAPAGGGFPGGKLHDDTYRYDGRNKITRANATVVGSGGFSHGMPHHNGYSAMGHLVQTDHSMSPAPRQRWIPDALGNHVHSYRLVQEHANKYEPGTGRLLTSITTADTSIVADTTTYYYTARGDQKGMRSARKKTDIDPPHTYGPDHSKYIVETTSQFDAERRLVEFRRLSTQQDGAGLSLVETYRYDALGRRIWRRALNGWMGTLRDSACLRSTPNTECESYVERTVWDGDHVLYEIRARAEPSSTDEAMESDHGAFSPLYGRVAYTHGPGIDQPIEQVRLDYEGVRVLVPHTDWQGNYDVGT